MGLPNYTGPFQVGAIDLEIPVREARSFGTEIVPNDQINAPRKKENRSRFARSRNEVAKEAAKARMKGGKGDYDTDAKMKRSPEDQREAQEEEEANQAKEGWDPFHSGSKTSTLHLATVLFTIYYPSNIKEEEKEYFSHLSWLGRPKRKGLAAVFNYLGQYGIFSLPAIPALLTLLAAKAPAYVAAPLANPNQDKARGPPSKDRVETGNFATQSPRFPVVIFSHGLAGNRLTYSQYCGELASQGIIVAAVEHRDGSGLSSVVRLPISSHSNKTLDDISKTAQKTKRHPKTAVPYFQFETVGLRSFAEDPNEKEITLRRAQMAMRAAEIEECLYVLRRISQGDGEAIAKSSTRGLGSKLGKRHRGRRREEDVRYSLEEEPKRLASWKGRLDTDVPCLVGHSFGGATVMEMQRKGPIVTAEGQEESRDSLFPFSIVLDPWVEPILLDENRPMTDPAYVINSETFTVWQSHFDKLKKILHHSREANKEHRGWLMTLCGCQHLDFSDMPFLLPHIFRSTVGPQVTIAIFSRATYAQMGLVRQRLREQEELPGAKANDPKDKDPHVADDEQLKLGQRESEKEGHDSEQDLQVQSPGPLEDHPNEREEVLLGSEADHKGSSFANQGNEDANREADNERVRECEEKTSFPRSNEKKWTSSMDDSPLTKARGGERDKHMSSLRERKCHAARKLKTANEEKKVAKEERKRMFQKERKENGLRAVIADRTSDGDLKGQRRATDEDIDFSLRAVDVDADRDAEAVHKSLEDISANLDYKRDKPRSLMVSEDGFLDEEDLG